METKRTIKATPNYSAQTFTLRVDYNDGVSKTKYRTTRLSKEEFNSCLNNTLSDWNNFLWNSSDYYRVQ